MEKLKTLKDIDFEQITDVRPDGYEGNAPGRKRIIKRKCVFCYILKQEAINWIKGCCGDHRIMSTMCAACRRFIKFFNLTKKDWK